MLTSVNDTAKAYYSGINDTAVECFTCVVDTGEAPKIANRYIGEIFEKFENTKTL